MIIKNKRKKKEIIKKISLTFDRLKSIEKRKI